MSAEQAATFPRRTVEGEHLSEDQLATMPRMISTDSHVMEPDELWEELPERLQANLPKVPFVKLTARSFECGSSPSGPKQ